MTNSQDPKWVAEALDFWALALIDEKVRKQIRRTKKQCFAEVRILQGWALDLGVIHAPVVI